MTMPGTPIDSEALTGQKIQRPGNRIGPAIVSLAGQYATFMFEQRREAVLEVDQDEGRGRTSTGGARAG